MAKTIQEILGTSTLIGVIKDIKDGLPSEFLPPAFKTVTRGVTGDSCKYRKVQGTRRLARLVQYGSPSLPADKIGITEVPLKLMHSFENQVHEPWVLQSLLNIGNESAQRMGQDEIARQSMDFFQRFTNLRTAAIFQMLYNGVVYFSAAGDMLPSSSGASTTVDAGIPAGNQNQLDVFGDGAIIDTVWSNAAADIIGDMIALKKAALRKTGYPLQHAFYSEQIPNYLVTNTKVKELINRSDAGRSALAQGEVPQGLFGLQWHPAYGAFFEDQAGDIQSVMAANQITFTPAPSPDWWEVIEGTFPIPTDVSVAADVSSLVSSLMDARGMFQYAVVNSLDPVSVKQLAGDTFLTINKVPGAVFKAVVAGF